MESAGATSTNTATIPAGAELFARSRAVGSAEDNVAPRVRFRSTPSVRYFKSSHSASFGADDKQGDEEEEAAQDPRCKVLRERRIQRRLQRDIVNNVTHYDRNEGERLIRKIADDARQRMESAVRQLVLLLDGGDQDQTLDEKGDSSEWRRRSTTGLNPANPGVNPVHPESRVEKWERRLPESDTVIIKTALPCTFRELQCVLATANRDELDAALLACLSVKLDATSHLETIETTVSDTQDQAQGQDDLFDDRDALHEPAQISITRVTVPRPTRLQDSAAQMWKLMKRNPIPATEDGDDSMDVIDCFVKPSLRGSSASSSSSSSSRILQQLMSSSSPSTASATGHDHAVLGDIQVGYFIQRCPGQPLTSVAMYVAKKKKTTKNKTRRSFPWPSSSTINDQLVARVAAIPQLMWQFIERRRLGFQMVAYPDFVYDVDDLAAAQDDVAQCPVCHATFGFFLKRHFCHLCALWVCTHCTQGVEIETHRNGWLQPQVPVCGACKERVHKCVYDYRRGAQVPGTPMILHDDASKVQASRSLARACVALLRKPESTPDDRQPRARVVETLIEVVTPDHSEDLKELLSSFNQASDDVDETVVETVADELLTVAVVAATRDCALSIDCMRRQYVLQYDDTTGHPQSPQAVDDLDRLRRIDKLQLLPRLTNPHGTSTANSLRASLDALCQVATDTLHCAMAFVSIVHHDHTFFVATSGASLPLPASLPRDDGFCAYTLQSLQPLVVLDMARDMRSRFFTLTTECKGRLYCGVPLLSGDGSFVVATFAVVDTRPRRALTTTEYALFKVVAQAAQELLVQELRPLQRPLEHNKNRCSPSAA